MWAKQSVLAAFSAVFQIAVQCEATFFTTSGNKLSCGTAAPDSEGSPATQTSQSGIAGMLWRVLEREHAQDADPPFPPFHGISPVVWCEVWSFGLGFNVEHLTISVSGLTF